MKKILIVISSLKRQGGAEKVAYTLGKFLEKKYEIFYFNFYSYKEEYDVKNRFCLNEEFSTSFLVKIKKLFKRSKEISDYTKRNDFKLILSFMEEANFSSILSKFFNKNLKVICSVRTNPKVAYEKSVLYNFLIKLLYPKSDRVITLSKGVEQILIKNYKIPKEKVKTIYNPHPIEEYQKLSNEPLEEKYKEIFKDSFVFINIGRLTEAKGQWFLIRAFRKVVEKYPKAKLIILGEGELKEKLQELIKKLNLQNNVFLLGRQDNVFKFLKNSYCFVFSSLWEGLPNTLIESLSVNLPIISTDCKTGPREILAPELSLEEKVSYPYYGKYGILTKPFPRRYIFKTLDEEPLIEEEKMLADLMIEMIENKDLRKKYSNGLERVKDFDVKKIVKEWEEVIEEVKS